MPLFGGPTLVSLTRQDNPTELLELEATLEETHVGKAETTDHPVESGVDITDHLRRTPEELTLKGIVSNHPILLLAPIRALPSIPGGDPATRAEDAYGWLLETKDQGLLLQISTTLRDYANMAIIGMNVARNKDLSNVLSLDLTLREIIIATTEKKEGQESAGAATNLGRKSPAAASAPVATESSSILASLVGALGL